MAITIKQRSTGKQYTSVGSTENIPAASSRITITQRSTGKQYTSRGAELTTETGQSGTQKLQEAAERAVSAERLRDAGPRGATAVARALPTPSVAQAQTQLSQAEAEEKRLREAIQNNNLNGAWSGSAAEARAQRQQADADLKAAVEALRGSRRLYRELAGAEQSERASAAAQAEYERLSGLDQKQADRALEAARRQSAQTFDIDKMTRAAVTPGGLTGYLEAARGENNAVQGKINALEADIEGAKRIRTAQNYMTNTLAPDFARNSRYRKGSIDDADYAYINRDPEAIKAKEAQMFAGNGIVLDIQNQYVEQMSDDQIAMFNYLYHTKGKDTAYEYIKFLEPDLNAAQRQQETRQWQAEADAHPAGASAVSVIMAPMKGASYLGQAVDYLADGKIDQNAAYNRYSYASSGIRQRVSELAEDKWGKKGSFLYQTGMSMGDFLMTTLVSGGFSNPGSQAAQKLALSIMGTGAAADSTIAAKDRGLSDDQAFAIGTIAGAAEVITEKVSLDNLLDMTKLGKNKLGYFLQNVLAEGSEEVGSDFINLFADILVAKDKSEWQQSIDQYKAQGMDEKTAFWHAAADQAENIGLDFLGGALSGGIMSGGGIVLNQATGNRQNMPVFDGVERQDAVSSGNNTENTMLTENDLEEYLKVGEREHVRDSKNTQVMRGQSPILTTIDQIKSFIRSAMGGNEKNTIKAYGKVGSRMAGDILAVDGNLDVSNYYLELDANRLAHLSEHVGDDGDARNIPLTQEQAENLTEYINGYDDILNVIRRKDGSIRVTLGKKINGHAVIVELVSKGRKSIQPVTAWQLPTEDYLAKYSKTKKTQTIDTSHLPEREKIGGYKPSMSINSIPQSAQKSKGIISDEARAAFGAEGQRVIDTVVERSVQTGKSKAAAYAAFARGYHQGVTGAKMTEVDGLSDEGLRIAYNAGKTDAKASMAREKKDAKFAPVAGNDAGVVLDEYVQETMESGKYDLLNETAKRLELRVRFVDELENGANANITGAEVLIQKDNQNPLLFLLGHEIAHRLQELAPKEYSLFRNIAVNERHSEMTLKRRESYQARGVEINYEGAMDELAADYAGQLMEGGQVLEDFIAKNREKRSLLEWLRDIFRELAEKLMGHQRQQAMTAEEALTKALEAAEKQAKKNAKKTGTKNTARTDGEARYALNESFAAAYDNWAQNYPNEAVSLYVGTTSDALKSIGVPDSRITWDTKKIQRIKGKHPNMTDAVLKQVPQIIENPVLIMQSKTAESRLTMFGTVVDENGTPVLAVLELKPKNRKGIELDELKIASAYGKDGAQGLIDSSDILYIDPNQKRTDQWLRDNRLQLPFSSTTYGSIGSISDSEAESKTRFSLTDSDGRKLTAEQMEFFKDSKVRNEQGQLLVVYHGTDAEFTVFDRTKSRANMDIQGNFFSPWELDAKGYGSKVGAYYLDIKKPADEVTGYRALKKFQGQNNAGVKARDYLIAQGYDGVNNEGEEYIAFYPEQIKSVDNLKPTDDPDIRFSMVDAKEFAEEVLKLQKAQGDKTDAQKQEELIRTTEKFLEKLQQQEERGITKSAAVRKTARNIIKSFGAKLKPSEIAGELQELYDYMAGGDEGIGEISYSVAREKAEKIARDVAESAVIVDDTLYQEFSGLRSYLRDTKIVVPEEVTREIGDFNDYRKSTMGKLVIGTKGHPNLDRVYSELCTMYPSWFDGEALAATDQLEQIVNAAEAIYNRPEYNPFEGSDMEAAVKGIAEEIMERFYDLPQEKGMKGLTAKERSAIDREVSYQLKHRNNQDMERLKKKLDRQKKRNEREMEKLKKRQEEVISQLENRNLRQRIEKKAYQMGHELLKGTDKKHIPEDFRGAVSALVYAINLESGYVWGFDEETGKKRLVKETIEPNGEKTKKTEDFRQLREQYRQVLAELKKANEDCMCELDEELVESINEVLKGQDKRIVDMEQEELQTVWQTLQALDHAMKNYGKVLSEAKYARTEEWATAIANSTRKNRRRQTNKTIDLETPYTFFDSLGEAGKEIFKILAKGRDKRTQMIQEILEKIPESVTPERVKKLEETLHTFTTERGEKLTLTTEDVMEIYALTRRKQAHDHLMEGGIHQPEIGSGKNKIVRGTDSIMLSMKDLQDIVSVLTPEETKIAVEMQELASTVLAKYGNDASMEVYGYKKFNERFYWPIVTSQEGKHTNTEKGANQPRNIRNIGMGKQTKPGANTPMEINGMFHTFAKHTADMVNYAAWLAPMADCERLYNFQFKNEDGGKTGKGVKSELQKKAGKEAIDYWNNLMEDMQNGIEPKSDTVSAKIINKLYGGFKGAAVGGNIRVVIQQPTAWFRALAVMNPADLAAGIKGGVAKEKDAKGKPMSGWEKAKKHAPIAVQKDMGGFDIGNQRSLYEMMFGTQSKLDKAKEGLTAGASKADAVTWGRLWNACEHAVHREQSELEVGSTEFFDAVSEKFTDMIDQTQVVDGVLQRSQAMRSSNAVVQQANAFMGEPTQSLNLFLRTWDAWRFEQNPEKRGKAMKNMGRAMTALVVTEAVNAVAQSIVDGFRDDDPDKDYWEKFMSAFTGIEGDEDDPWDYLYNIAFRGNLGSNLNPVNKIPFVKDLAGLFKGYSVNRGEMEVLSDIASSAKMVISSMSGEGTHTRKYALNELIRSVAKVTGLPVQNLERDIWSMLRTFTTDNIPVQYEMEKAIYNLSNSDNKKRFLDVMFRALEQEDYESYDHIRRDLMETGVIDGKEIDSGMKSRVNDRRKKDPDFALPERAADLIGWRTVYREESEEKFDEGNLNATQYKAFSEDRAEFYRKYTSQIEGNQYFSGMDEKTREKIYSSAEKLSAAQALENNSAGQYEIDTKWMLWATGGAAAGVDETEAILFKAAYDMASGQDENGKSVSGLKKQRALETAEQWMPWLSKEEKEYLMKLK